MKYFVGFLLISTILCIYVAALSIHYILWNILTDSAAYSRAEEYFPMLCVSLAIICVSIPLLLYTKIHKREQVLRLEIPAFCATRSHRHYALILICVDMHHVSKHLSFPYADNIGFLLFGLRIMVRLQENPQGIYVELHISGLHQPGCNKEGNGGDAQKREPCTESKLSANFLVFLQVCTREPPYTFTCTSRRVEGNSSRNRRDQNIIHNNSISYIMRNNILNTPIEQVKRKVERKVIMVTQPALRFP